MTRQQNILVRILEVPKHGTLHESVASRNLEAREEVSAYVRSIGFTRVSIWNASEGVVLCEIATASARVRLTNAMGLCQYRKKNTGKRKW
jgi:hypothetical protein